MDIPADSLVQSFLQKARADKVAALVVYGLTEHGKPVLRVASNSDDKGTQGILNWLARTDERTVEACARDLHERKDGCYICTAFQAVASSKPIPRWTTAADYGWDAQGADAVLSDYDKERHREVVRNVLEVARVMAGRTLNVTKIPA